MEVPDRQLRQIAAPKLMYWGTLDAQRVSLKDQHVLRGLGIEVAEFAGLDHGDCGLGDPESPATDPVADWLQPAPAGAIVDLLNSRACSSLTDKLDSPESAAIVLRPFGAEDGVLPPEQLDLIRSVRADLLDLVTSGEPARDWARLTSRVSQITYQQDFSTPGQVDLHQVTGDPVVGRIMHDVATLVTEGNWSRVRVSDAAGNTTDQTIIAAYPLSERSLGLTKP